MQYTSLLIIQCTLQFYFMHVLLLSVYQAIFYSGEIKHTTLPLKDTVATEPPSAGAGD